MAWSGPALTKVVAAANGTNNLALSDPSSQGPYRTDVQAVADGSLIDGRTVHYGAWRTTTENDAEFEEGHGVYTAATRTIARTAGNVLDGSNGPGVLVDFGLSGQMDVLFYPVLDGSNIPSPAEFATNLGLPRLAATNFFTDNQAILRSGAPGNMTAGSTLTTGAVGLLNLRGNDSGGAQEIYGRMVAYALDATAGSEDGRLDFDTMVGGVQTTVARITGGVLTERPSGNKYDAFPSGQVLLSESVPPGWVRGDVTGGRLIKLATSSDTLGAQAGSDDFFDGALATQGHVLVISQVPAHAHGVFYKVTDFPVGTGLVVNEVHDGGFGSSGTKDSDSAGGGGSHSHTITTPNYRVMGRIVKI